MPVGTPPHSHDLGYQNEMSTADEQTSPTLGRIAFADPDAASVELSERRTGMSFQRTRMSADRTLMSVIRTSLSLITFGFTIFQFFQHFRESTALSGGERAAHHFGLSLVLLGIVMLGLGIVYHLAFMGGLRRERRAMAEAGLVHAESGFPPSLTLIVAVLLLLIGLLAVASIAFKLGPFS
jgi:putative membrane protein